MKFRSKNIGSEHESFDHSDSKFTQVLILDQNDNIIAHFTGISAKKCAMAMLSKLNKG